MDMIIPDAFHPDGQLSEAIVHRVVILKNSTLDILPEIEGKDYHLVQMSPDLVMLADHVNGELIFEDALEVHTSYGMDAKILEALRKHRMETGQLVTLMSPLHMREQLPIPEGAHRAFWAYTLP